MKIFSLNGNCLFICWLCLAYFNITIQEFSIIPLWFGINWFHSIIVFKYFRVNFSEAALQTIIVLILSVVFPINFPKSPFASLILILRRVIPKQRKHAYQVVFSSNQVPWQGLHVSFSFFPAKSSARVLIWYYDLHFPLIFYFIITFMRLQLVRAHICPISIGFI